MYKEVCTLQYTSVLLFKLNAFNLMKLSSHHNLKIVKYDWN